MAIKRLKRNDGTVYYRVDYRFPRTASGERRREAAGTLDEAKAMETQIIKELLAGRDPRIALGKTGTFKEHAEEVLAKHYSKMRCHAWAKLVIEKHLIPAFGKLPLGSITTKRITDYMHERQLKGKKPATINNERAILSKILSLAVDWDRLSPGSDPMRKAPKFEALTQRDRWLSPKEQRALVAKAKGHVRDVIILALGTGSRHGEALALEWKSVDLDRGLLTFTASTTKSGEDRIIPINGAVLAMLKARREDKRTRFSPYVFTYKGKPIKSINTGFAAARTDAGLGKEVTMHTLRHTFCTRFGHAGGNIRDLQALAGHADLKTTERYYHQSDGAARVLGLMANDLTAPATDSAAG
jgi:integrase